MGFFRAAHGAKFVLSLNISFNFCARLGFNVVWFVKCIKRRKLRTEIISI